MKPILAQAGLWLAMALTAASAWAQALTISNSDREQADLVALRAVAW